MVTTTRPTAPTRVIATAQSTTSIRVSWATVSGATEYQVFRNTTSGSNYTHVRTITATSFTDTGLSPNTTYFYIIHASNNAGRSPQSLVISATTQRAQQTEIIFNYTGPDGVNVRLLHEGQFITTIAPRNTFRRNISNQGIHNFTVQIGEVNERRAIASRGSTTINIDITARRTAMGVVITNFEIINRVPAIVRYVNSDSLNVRNNSNVNAARIDNITKDTRVEILEEYTNDWARIKYSNNRTGYVYGNLLTSTQPRATTSTSGAVQLAFNTFVSSNLTTSIQSRTFSFTVTNGTRYSVWLDDWDQNSSNVDALISAQYSGGANIFTDVDIAYPQQFTANRTGTVILTITPRTRGHTGNFRVGYNSPR